MSMNSHALTIGFLSAPLHSVRFFSPYSPMLSIDAVIISDSSATITLDANGADLPVMADAIRICRTMSTPSYASQTVHNSQNLQFVMSGGVGGSGEIVFNINTPSGTQSTSG